MPDELRRLLERVAAGTLPVDEAAARLRVLQDGELGYACVDHDRRRRLGFPEVIFGGGKTPAQVLGIFRELTRHHDRVLATRVDEDAARAVLEEVEGVVHHVAARALSWTREPLGEGSGRVLVLAAGTADLPVAEEAALTARLTGARVVVRSDVGVAGLHRLLRIQDELLAARALVVVAGMEGALPSVVAGLVPRPVLAVPTSVGYGAAFGGVAALLGMLNTCAAGVATVNIDNGFGAGYLAGLINRLAEPE